MLKPCLFVDVEGVRFISMLEWFHMNNAERDKFKMIRFYPDMDFAMFQEK